MKRKFITNLIFLLGLNIIIKSFWIFGIDMGVQNALPSEDYGLYFALFNFTYLFNIILDFGITNYNNRVIAQHSHLLQKYIARLLPIKLLMAVVFTVVVFSVALIAGYDTFSLKMLGWMCFAQFLSSLILYLRSNISGLLLFKTDSILSVMDRFLMIVFCCLLLYTSVITKEFKIQYFVYAQVLSYFITALVALLICLYKTKFIKLKWSKVFTIKVLKDCFPYALLALLMAFYNRVDSVMIERILPEQGAEQSAIYASAFRLVDAANMIAYLFSILLLPIFARLIKEKGNIKEIVKVSFHLLLILTVSFAILSQIYGMDLMNLLYNKHIEDSACVYRILSFCFIPISMTYIFGTLLTANGSMKRLNQVAFIGMCLNIGFNIFLVPRFFAQGAAYSSLIAQTITALAQALIALRLFEIRFNLSYMMRILMFVVSLIIIAILLKGITSMWILNFIITAFAMLVLSFIFRLFNIKEIFKLVRFSKE